MSKFVHILCNCDDGGAGSTVAFFFVTENALNELAMDVHDKSNPWREQAMTKKIEPFVKNVVITVNHDDPAYQAVKKMVEFDVGSVVVVDRTQGGKAVGIITKTSIFKALLKGSPPDGSRLVIEGKTCQDIMSSPLITVKRDTPYTEAMGKLKKHAIDHLVVVDDEGKPAGFLSVRDLFLMLNLEGFT